MKRSIRLVLAATVCIVAISATTFVASQSNDTTPVQLRVIWTSDPATQATVSWSSLAEGTEHVVYYDTNSRGGDPGDYSDSVEVTESGQYGDETFLPFFHHGRLADLEPDTEYFFVVSSDGDVSEERSFRTAHDDDREFKLLYGGDSRSNRDDRQRMNDRMKALFSEDEAILALAHGGDYIAYANNWEQWTAWLDDHETLTSDDGRILPIMPARGNHEGRGTIYNQVFGNPGGDASINYFVSDFGPNRVITLDSEASQAGDQRDWLIEQLEDSQDAKWVVAGYHRPAWPTVKSPAGAKEHWVPLFEQYNVDMVLESDGHALKRTPPIRNDRIDYTGVVYVGEGGLGVRQRTPYQDRWYLQTPGMAMSAHHVQVITFGDELLRYEAVIMDGLVADEITVPSRESRLESNITAAVARATSLSRVEIVFTRPYNPSTTVDPSQFEIDGVDVDFVQLGSEVQAVLALVNSADEETLDDDVRLDGRAARNIVAWRNGDDERADTDDDNRFETWEELDAISYVGASALGKLGAYATEQTVDQRNAITLQTDTLEEGESYTVQISGVEDVDGKRIEAGTTVSFTVPIRDDRADAIEAGERRQEETSSGCSTTDATPSPWFLLFLGFFAMRRRSR